MRFVLSGGSETFFLAHGGERFDALQVQRERTGEARPVVAIRQIAMCGVAVLDIFRHGRDVGGGVGDEDAFFYLRS